MRDCRRNHNDYDGALETDDVLVRAGIDPEAMGYLTGKERREILIRAGLNPKDFDFYSIEKREEEGNDAH